ncbi:MAG TPA: PKD domain-containing protein [Candidatus Thermoplasmatota archaeon]
MGPRPASLLILIVLLAGCMGGGGPKQVPSGDLQASFTITPDVAALGEPIQFTDTSTGSIELWRWDFDDGNTSDEQHPSHTFRAAGTYDITLLIEDALGNVDSATQPLSIGSIGGPDVFRIDFRYSVSGRTVDFEPIVTPEGAIVDIYHWDFGDEETSRESAPSHTYAAENVYAVTLRGSSNARISQAKHLIAIGVAVGEPTDLASKSFAVIAIIDSGVNPYHSEFRDDRFDAHPSQYVMGYPQEASELRLALDAPTFKAATTRDEATWEDVETRDLYWIPGTRIIGAISMDPYGATPILDEDGHGTATASDAAGATVGTCPECLLVIIEGPGDAALEWAFEQPWIDAVSNSWTFCIPAPAVGCSADPGVIPAAVYDSDSSREAVEAGQEVLFAAGNGVLNAFDAPTLTYLHSQTGPDWILTIGSSDASNSARTVGTGRPFDVTSYGVNWRGASHQSMNSIRTFSGTSAATPVVAGAYAQILMTVRERLGDTDEGPRPGAIVAQGTALSGMVSDGKLTRAEAERALLITAKTDGSAATANPAGLPGGPASFLYSGYGLINAASAADAVKVAIGDMPAPARATEDLWASVDSEIRQALWGPWNPGGDLRDADPEPTDVDELLSALGMTRADLGLA